uniref:Uncharacterized protein n=1 Tax=Plectus sambesii TaxID=2011161 RepID=A0A914WQ15_9BILA
MCRVLALPLVLSLIVVVHGEDFCGGYENRIYYTFDDCVNDCLCNCHSPCECPFVGGGFICRASKPPSFVPQFEYLETTEANEYTTTPYYTYTNYPDTLNPSPAKIYFGLIAVGVLLVICFVVICFFGVCCCGWFGIRPRNRRTGRVVLPASQQPTVVYKTTVSPPSNPVFIQTPSAPPLE